MYLFLTKGSTNTVPSSWFPSEIHPGCLLCALAKISILRVPGEIRSSIVYISSGFRLVSRTGDTRTSQSRFVLILRQEPFRPTRQCSLEWLSQWPAALEKDMMGLERAGQGKARRGKLIRHMPYF